MKKICCLLYIISGIILSGIPPAMGQEPAARQISGTVREEGTGKPVPNVSIFFDGTLNGTTSDSSGNFTLYPRTGVKLPILVSGVGYYPGKITDYSYDRKLTIDLKVRSYDLDAVTVTANDGMPLREKLRIFRREFLGTSANAKSCEILNEDDLRFTYSRKGRILKASCDKPLIIRNKNLGYTLNFLLTGFTWSPEQTEFYGSEFFTEEASPADPEKVKKARKNAYLGSQMHFIRALWEDRLAQNDFSIAKRTKRIPYDSIVVIRDNQKYLHFTGQVTVAYGGQFSSITGNGTDIPIDKNGYVYPVGTVWTGVIGMQRAGDLLPLEYDEVISPRESREFKKEINSKPGFITVLQDTLRPFEKLYIQTDKPYYSSGDTLRMKAYLLVGPLLRGSEKSGIVYIELANDSNKVLFRRMLPVGYGLGAGNIVLNKDDIPEGSYILRAYTNLMRNLGDEAVFKKSLYISGATTRNWLVNASTTLSKVAGKDNLRLALQFNQLNSKALALHELDLRVVNGRKVLQRDKVQTDIDGKMDINFNLPDQGDTGNLSLIAADPKNADQRVTVPIPVNRAENIDLQFMPEGGNLVAGIPSRVGFKAIGEDGNAAEVSGKIYNTNNEEVASFSSSYKGMGSFELKPMTTSAYTARIMTGVTPKSFPLPAVRSTGSVLRISSSVKSDSLLAVVTISSNLSTANAVSYHLVGQSGGKICYDEEIPVTGNTLLSKVIAKDLFPTGIARFTLFSADRQPLNERIVFINHHDNLEISVNPDRTFYQTRDSVSLVIEVRDNDGRPVEGSFSLAVTDDSQVRTDSLSANILTSILLTSGLKGTIEQPGHYLQATEQAAADLDNLLLTQGWIGYNWKEMLNPPQTPAYPAEPEFVVRGKVTNAFNKGSAVTAIQLLSLKPAAAKIGVTEKDGSFAFGGLPVAEDMKFFLRAKNKNNKSFNVGIEVDEFKPMEFKPESRRSSPWYVNSDTVLLRQASTRAVQDGKLSANGTNLLAEVTITRNKVVKDSKNLNGAGEADQIIDEKDLAEAPKKTLMDLMQEKIRGFNLGIWPARNNTPVGINNLNSYPIPPVSGPGGMGTASRTILGTMPYFFEKTKSYQINDKELHLVIDGIDVESLYFPTYGFPFTTTDPQLALQRKVSPGGNYILERNAADPDDRMNFIRLYLDGILAEDVKGIEVMYDPRYNARYKAKYASTALQSLSLTGPDFAYVEVTTYSGNGAFVKTPPGVYLHKPLSYVNSAAFYRPKYTSKAIPVADLRSTIHWEPDIVTNTAGKAIVSFYSADRPGTYSIIIEGSNMNGNVGRNISKITIK